MQHYSDKSNEQGAAVLFMVMQMCMAIIVYGFIYTAFAGVKLAVAEYHLTFMVYLPELVATLFYPVIALKTMRVFRAGRRLRAVALLLGWASVIIVLLYAHLSQLIPA